MNLLSKILLYILYIYTIVGFYLKIKGYEIMNGVPWSWVVGPFWVFVLGPPIIRALFLFVLRRGEISVPKNKQK